MIKLKLIHTNFPVSTPFCGMVLTLLHLRSDISLRMSRHLKLTHQHPESFARRSMISRRGGFFLLTPASTRIHLCMVADTVLLLELQRFTVPANIQIYYISFARYMFLFSLLSRKLALPRSQDRIISMTGS